MRKTLLKDFDDLRDQILKVIEERDLLRQELAQPEIKELADPTGACRILKEALDNRQGWRADARKLLGLASPIACEFCGTLFPRGGKRRLYCSTECRIDAYRGKTEPRAER